MISSTMNLIMTVLGFAVSTTFIAFVCARLFCARLRRRQRARLFVPEMEINHLQRSIERSFHGVDPTLVRAFPTMKYCQETFASRDDALCTVCLAEYEEKEVLRALPKCGHAFHVACIDAWLQQNTTCPICRISLGASPEIRVPQYRIDMEGHQSTDPILSSTDLLHSQYSHYNVVPVMDQQIPNAREGQIPYEATNMGAENLINDPSIRIVSESRGSNGQVESFAENEQRPAHWSFCPWRSSKKEEQRSGASGTSQDRLSTFSANGNIDLDRDPPHGEGFTTASGSDSAGVNSKSGSEKKLRHDQCNFSNLEGPDLTSKENGSRQIEVVHLENYSHEHREEENR